MAVFYLDVDDEITSAAQRIRSTSDRSVALVLPANSRLATSRINFRLLAREAGERARSLVIVAPEASARALAASAGLPVFATVADYEAEGEAARAGATAPAAEAGLSDGSIPASARPASGEGTTATGTSEATVRSAVGRASGGRRGRDGDGSGAAAAGAASAGASAGAAAAADAQVHPVPTRPGARSGAATSGSLEVARPVGRSRRGLWVALAALLVLLAAAAAAAWLLLPSASIVIAPREETVGPLSLSVKADPSVTTADPATGVVPAQALTIPLQAQGEFTATGVKVTETKATGSVTFTSNNTLFPVRVPLGTQVATLAGVVFVTTESVVVPAAQPPPPRYTQGTVTVPVVALSPGPAGNVSAGSITQDGTDLSNNRISVNNAAATSGGTHTEAKVVAQKDIDGAVAQLTRQLADQLSAQLADPGAAPAGTTVFPATKSMTTPAFTPDPASLANQAESTFQLSASATGSVTAVSEDAIRQLADGRIRSEVPADHQLVDGSVAIQLGEAQANGGVLTFPVTVSALDVRKLDADTLRQAVKGKPVDEARAYLQRFGEVRLDTWPGWTSAIPTYDFRLDLRIEPALPPASASPSPPPSAPGSAAASPPPSTTGSGASPAPSAS